MSGCDAPDAAAQEGAEHQHGDNDDGCENTESEAGNEQQMPDPEQQVPKDTKEEKQDSDSDILSDQEPIEQQHEDARDCAEEAATSSNTRVGQEDEERPTSHFDEEKRETGQDFVHDTDSDHGEEETKASSDIDTHEEDEAGSSRVDEEKKDIVHETDNGNGEEEAKASPGVNDREEQEAAHETDEGNGEEEAVRERSVPGEENTEISAIMSELAETIGGDQGEAEDAVQRNTAQTDASCQTEPVSPSGSFMMTQLKQPRVESRDRSARDCSEVDEQEVIRVVNALNCGCSQSRKLDSSLSRASPKRKRKDQQRAANWLSPSGRSEKQASERSQSERTSPIQRKPVSAEWKSRTGSRRGGKGPAVVKPGHKAPRKRAQEVQPKQEPRVEEEEQEEKLPQVLDDVFKVRSVENEEETSKEASAAKEVDDEQEAAKGMDAVDGEEEKIVFGEEPDAEQIATTRTETERDEDQIDKILRYELPPPDEQNEVMKYIKTRELTAIIDEEYVSARRVQEAEEILMTRPITAREVDDHYMSAQARLSRARDTYEQKSADWQKRMDEFEAKSAETMENLKASQAEEAQKFEEHWRKDLTVIPYTKASVGLLAIRSHQKVCALTKDFEAALDAQNSADDRQVDEEIIAEQRAVRAMKIAHQQLWVKHEQQRNCATEHAERLRFRLETQKNLELQETSRLIQNLENSLNEPYVARARVRTQTRAITRSQECQSMPVTPRTRQNLADYKGRSNQCKLRLNGMTVTQSLHSPTGRKSKPITPRTTKRYGGYK